MPFKGDNSELTKEALAAYAAQLRAISTMLEATSELMKDCRVDSVIVGGQKNARLGIKNLDNFQTAVKKVVREAVTPSLARNASSPPPVDSVPMHPNDNKQTPDAEVKKRKK